MQREGKMKDFNMDNYKSYLSSLDVPNRRVVMFTSNISPSQVNVDIWEQNNA